MPAVLVTVPTAVQNLQCLPQRWSISSPVLIAPTYGGMARLSGLQNTGIVDPLKVVTNPRTNRAQCSLTLSMWPTLLPLRQTSQRCRCNCYASMPTFVRLMTAYLQQYSFSLIFWSGDVLLMQQPLMAVTRWCLFCPPFVSCILILAMVCVSVPHNWLIWLIT